MRRILRVCSYRGRPECATGPSARADRTECATGPSARADMTCGCRKNPICKQPVLLTRGCVINTERLEDHDVIFLLSETNNPNYLQKALDGRFSCIVRLSSSPAGCSGPDIFWNSSTVFGGTSRYFSTDEELSSQEKQYRCASAPRSLLQPPLLMLTSCLHHTKQQTWIDRPFSRAAPSL
ncbi:unnamed protein product [Pleuronectes platessa]|uniref:Uncharacterized protein n=1 Tax=Pleuronectes platessa TaxID=8262 RepID=A0A9N7Z1S3_PLEPL|nr:unnamed protein product [Pleuronectes platessa]